MTYVIRLCRPEEAGDLLNVEAAAGERFREVGLPEIADNPTSETDFVKAFLRGGIAQVAIDGADRPVGFCLTGELDGGGHIYELSVHPAHGRQGLGKRLVDAACDAVRVRGARYMTLSTFKDVPWNAPFYARLGFEMLDIDELTPALLILHQREQAGGMPMSRRCMMRKPLRTY